MGSNRDYWLYMRRHSSGRYSCHGHYLLGRLVQASRRLANGRYHCEQECLGLRLCGVHHPVGGEEWFRASDHDQRIFDHALVLVWHTVLLLRQDLPKMVEGQLGPQAVAVLRVPGVLNRMTS